MGALNELAVIAGPVVGPDSGRLKEERSWFKDLAGVDAGCSGAGGVYESPL